MKIVVIGRPEQAHGLYKNIFTILDETPEYIQPDIWNKTEELEADVVCVSREWIGAERLEECHFLRKKVPVVYLMDGVIEWSYIWNNQSYVFPSQSTVLQPLLADALCVLGPHPARILASMGLGNRIHITGLSRFDDFPRERILEIGKKPRIVISTARTYAHNVEQQVFVRRALEDLKEYFQEHPEIDVCWRIERELVPYLGVPDDRDKSLREVLQRANGLISFPSTCVLEGMALHLPTAQIEYRNVPLYVQSAWEIRSKEHIPAVVHELLYPPAEKLAYQDFCLEDEIDLAPTAAERIARVIREMVEKFQKNETEPAPIEHQAPYGKLDYHQVHSQLSSFSILPISKLQYELEATERYFKTFSQLYNHTFLQVFFKIARLFRFLPGFRKISRILENIAAFPK